MEIQLLNLTSLSSPARGRSFGADDYSLDDHSLASGTSSIVSQNDDDRRTVAAAAVEHDGSE